MKKTDKHDKKHGLDAKTQAPAVASKFVQKQQQQKPKAAKTVAKAKAPRMPAAKTVAETAAAQAELQRMEQEMLSLSMLSNFGAAQEHMLNSRLAQMMHKMGHVKSPFLRMAFMKRSLNILGRQQPRIEASKAEMRKPKAIRRKKPKKKLDLCPLPL